MAAHPAGKGRRDDDQVGIEQLLHDVAAGEPLPAFEDAVFSTLYELADLLIRKQADYGPDAINRSPGGPLNGINVRMHDKLSRVINLTGERRAYVNESIIDTYRDIANYAVIALMVIDRTWPE